MRRRSIASAAVLILAAGACGNDDVDNPVDGDGDAQAWQTCENATEGYEVEYPPEWATNEGAVMEPCSLFDPEPIDVPQATEIPLDIAVIVTVDAVAFEDASAPDPFDDELDRESGSVDGREAVRIESRGTGEVFLPEGTESTRWLVDLDGRTLGAATYDVGEPPYGETQQVLDRMVASLRLTDPADPPTEPPDGVTAPAPAPDTWIGHDSAHRLVVVDAGSGQVTTVLAEFDDPETFEEQTGEPFAAGAFLGGFTLSPDGRTVYYEQCCEPAPSLIFRVPVEGGEPEQVAHGADPALAPDGSRLAVIELQWITLLDLATGEASRLEAADPPMALANLAWSPDGRWLAFEQYDEDLAAGRIMVLPADTAGSLDDARPVGADVAGIEGTPTLPSFDDGERADHHERAVHDRVGALAGHRRVGHRVGATA